MQDRCSERASSRRLQRGCGGIGRRAGFKIRFRKECRFEPDHPHQHLIRRLTLVVDIAVGTVVEAVAVLARA